MKRKWWILLIAFFTLFSLVPTFYELWASSQLTKLRSFELIHNYFTDYNFYLSRIREGWNGRTSVIELYTSEPHGGSLIQIFYLFLGQLSRFIPDPLFAVNAAYHVIRVVLGFTLLCLIASLVKRTFQKPMWQIIAFLLVATASNWTHIVPVGNGWRLGGYMSWWTIMDSLQRITFLPHILLGQCLMLFLVLSGNNKKIMEKKKNWMFLGFLGLVLGITFPPGIVFVITVYGLLVLFDITEKGTIMFQKSFFKEYILPKLSVIGIALFSLLYYALIFREYPWKRLIEVDIIHPLPFHIPDYIQALGPTLPLGLIGLILSLRNREKSMRIPVVWTLSWLLLLFTFQFIPEQSPLRFTEMAPQIGLGILTGYLFLQITNYKLQITKTRHPQPVTSIHFFFRFLGYLIPLGIITLGLSVMYCSFLWQKDFIDQKVRAGWPPLTMKNYIVYPIKTIHEALDFIEEKTPENVIILSGLTVGNYIPAETGRTVFYGHDNTVEREKKELLVQKFYSGKMDKKEAQKFLTDNGIDYVYFGPEEKEEGENKPPDTYYSFLTPVFTNADTMIFTTTTVPLQ